MSKARRIGALGLAFLFLAQTGNLAAKERKGAEVIIGKKDGLSVRGELIAVKRSSLLVLGSPSQADESVDVSDISHVQVVRESHVLEKAGFGLAFGASLGAAIGFAAGDDPPGTFLYATAGQKALLGAAAIGFIGLTVGLIKGAVDGIDQRYEFEAKSESKINSSLERLSKKARIQNIQ